MEELEQTPLLLDPQLHMQAEVEVVHGVQPAVRVVLAVVVLVEEMTLSQGKMVVPISAVVEVLVVTALVIAKVEMAVLVL